MIAALTLSALVGNWMCTSIDEPRAHFTYTFTRNGTGSFAEIRPNHRPETMFRFTYAVGSGYVFLRSSVLARANITVHGRELDDDGYAYWREGDGWVAPSTQNHYKCKRER